MFFLQAKIVCRSYVAHENCSKMICFSTSANYSVCHSMLWCFISAVHWNTQDSYPITKQMRTCGMVQQIWVSLHNLYVVLLKLICETLWNKLHADLPLSIIFRRIWWTIFWLKFGWFSSKNEGHTWVSGHQFTNFCNCFCTASNWQLTTTWLPSRSLCPFLNLLNYLKKCTRQLHFHEQMKRFQPFPE